MQTIVRDLWALRLTKLVDRLESPHPLDSANQAPSSAEETGHDGAPKRHEKAGRGIGSPKLVHTVALCYMGIMLLRVPISLGEVYRSVSSSKRRVTANGGRWIKEEDILYIRAIRGVPDDMREKLPGEYHKVLDTTVRWLASIERQNAYQ